MTVRLIVVELAEDTSETECGDCRWNESYWHAPDDFGGTCRIYGGREDGARVPECVEAEARASRMVEISPEDALGVSIAPRSYHRTDIDAADRVRDALRDHAKKGGGDGG